MNRTETKKLVSLLQLHKSKRIWWIDSYPTLRRWVMKDIDGSNYLKTIRIGKGNATRFYIPEENIEIYVRKFEGAKF